jgi:hypothetical protein
MAARTTQLALLIDQLMPALQAKPPMLAGNVFAQRRGTSFSFYGLFGFSFTVHFFARISPSRIQMFRLSRKAKPICGCQFPY